MATRTLSFEEFAWTLPSVFEEVSRDHQPVHVEKDGKLFRLLPPDPRTQKHDPEAVRRALRESAGALRGLDREAFLEEMHAVREQHSHGRPA